MSRYEWLREVDTVADEDALEDLHSGLRALWSARPDIPEDVRVRISVAASEVCTNIIEHSAARSPIRLCIHLRLTSDQIRVVFTDEGSPAVVDLTSVAMPAGAADRGRGLAIAKALLDELTYRREDGTNRWTLVVAVSPTPLLS